MKHCFGKSLWGVLAFALMLSACGGKKSKATDEPTRQDTTIGSRTVAEFSIDSTTLVWIQDNAGDKLMPRTLFADAPGQSGQQSRPGKWHTVEREHVFDGEKRQLRHVVRYGQRGAR